MKQEDQEATTLALAETFTADAVVDAGGESPNSDEKEMGGPTAAASPALNDSEGAAEKEQGDNDKDQALIAPSGLCTVPRTALLHHHNIRSHKRVCADSGARARTVLCLSTSACLRRTLVHSHSPEIVRTTTLVAVAIGNSLRTF